MPLQSTGEVVLKAMRDARVAAKAAVVRSEQQADSMQQKTVTFKAIGCDEFGIITGIGGAAGSVNKLDLDEEYLEKGDLMKLAFDFCGSQNRTFKACHDDDSIIDAKLVQSWVGTPIIKAGDSTRSLGDHELLTKDMEVVGIDTVKGREGWWFVSVLPADPEVVKAAREGRINGFSWGASVTKTAV